MPPDSCLQPENTTRYHKRVRPDTVKRLARECGFELSGVARAEPVEDDVARYQEWTAQGMAGEMRYLTDRRADVRRDPQNLWPGARSIICVGKLYNQSPPPERDGHAIFSRYAWGRDYHDVLREALEQLAQKLAAVEQHQWKICVDSAPEPLRRPQPCHLDRSRRALCDGAVERSQHWPLARSATAPTSPAMNHFCTSFIK